MSSVEVSKAHRSPFELARISAAYFGQWWLSSLRETVPKGWLKWADGADRPIVDVRRDDDGVICRVVAAGTSLERRFSRGEFNADSLTRWLVDQRLTRDGVVVRSIVARELFFEREINVPKAAMPALSTILDQDLVRRTPFQTSEVWHGAIGISSEVSDPISIRHCIVRKDKADVALADLGLNVDDIDVLAVRADDDRVVPVLTLRGDDDRGPVWALRLIRLLAAVGLAAILLGLLLFEWDQARVAASIEEDLAEIRETAQSGRDAIDPAARLLAIKADVGVLDVLEELSPILPDHTFLTEANIVGGKVVIAGFSADAARLVRIIDRSTIFADAALTGGITPDTNEHKERFTITFKVKGARLLKQAVAQRGAS